MDNMSKVTAGQYHLISSTAKLVAYWRQYSDIPYARDVAQLAEADKTAKIFFGDEATAQAPPIWVTAYIEARYKSMMQAIDHLRLKQVLELASGLSLRGLAATRQRPDITYVETDLQGIHSEKERIVALILAQEQSLLPANLRFCVANALQLTDLEAASSRLDPCRPIAIVHEGLCQYLSMDEKRQLATNIYELLGKFGGVWITPDLEPNEAKRRRHWDRNQDKQIVDAIAKQTGRHLEENSFETTREMEDFFTKLGFSLSSSPIVDDDMTLSTLNNQTAAGIRMKKEREYSRLWYLRVA